MLDPSRLKNVSVIFEDDALLAVNKPAGLAVHGGAETKNELLSVLASAGAGKLYLAHRLDKATSGVVLLCKSAELAAQVQAVWQSVDKYYRALVFGAPEPQTISTPLAGADGRNQNAESHLDVMEPVAFEPEVSWVTLRLGTGRKHQLRKHLAGIGHPIVMDDKYGQFRLNKQFRRAVGELGQPRPKHLFLHARYLELPHPVRDDTLVLQAELPSQWNIRFAAPLVDGPGSPG